MNAWNQLYEWFATLIVASLTWAYGALSPALPPSTDAAMPGRDGLSFMVGWAQEVDQPPIEQVGEGTGDDVETLDEGAPPPQDAQPVEQETLDAEAAPAAQEDDVELLDQGAPPATTSATGQPVETVYVAPVADTSTTYVAPEPAVATGPVLPEGFGTGRVHAVAGRAAIAPGLEDCHVGAVTGRAYVGLDCGEDEGSSFVGHAPSFEEFPFVIDAEFPFEGDEAFFSDDFPFGDDAELSVAAERDDEANTDVFVSAGRGGRAREADQTNAPVIETSGESSVQFAQRASDRDPRVRADDRASRRNERSDQGRRNDVNTAAGDDRANTESEKKAKKDDGNANQVNAESKEKKSKDKKDKKSKESRADRKGKRDRSRDDR